MSRQDSDLQNRWDEASTATTLKSLLKGKPASPHGTHQGRIDLRGLVIEQPGRTRVDENFERIDQIYEFDGRRVEGVDLSHSVLPEWRLSTTEFTDCVFDYVSMPSLRTYSATFANCSFGGADLESASLGAFATRQKHGGYFADCDFTEADLRHVSVEHGRFSECTFVASRWRDTRTFDAVFEKCDFRDAEVSGVFFDGRRFENRQLAGLNDNKLMGCDFSTTRLNDTSFLALDFRNFVAPKADRYVLVRNFPARVNVAVDRLKANGSREAAGLLFIFEMEFKAASALPKDATGMLDFGSLSEADARLLAAVFELSL